nr:zinc ribbon domain-containing protein [Clostridia bacterium]
MENSISSVLAGVFGILFIIGFFYLFYRMIRAMYRANRNAVKNRKRQQEIRVQRDHELALAKEERAKAEAEAEARKTEARMREVELQEERNRKNVLERSTVTVDGKTKTVADIVSEHINHEITGKKFSGSTDAGIERLNMAQVKCLQCGGSIDPGSKFCKFCGTQVPDNVFHAEVKIHDEAQLKDAEYRHIRENKFLHRLSEAQKATAKSIEASADKIRAKSEARKIELEEKARLQKIEQERKEREHQEKMAKAREAYIKSSLRLLIVVMIAIIGLILLSRVYR